MKKDKPSYQELENRIKELESNLDEFLQKGLLKSDYDTLKLKEHLKLVIEASGAGTWDWNITKNTFSWSEEFFKIFGISANTKPGFNAWKKVLHPEDIENATKKVQAAIDNRTDLINDYRIILPNHEVRWIRTTAKLHCFNNKPVRMVGLCIDITEQLKKEEQLVKAKEKVEESEKLYRLLAENSSDVVWLMDLNLNLIYVSPSTESLFGYRVEDRVRLSIDKMYKSETIEFLHNLIEQQIKKYYRTKNNDPQVFEIEGIHKNGNPIYFETSAKFVIDEKGQITGIQGSSRDLTERKKANVEILKAKEKAEQSDQKYRLLFEYTGSTNSIFDRDCRLILQNSNSRKELGKNNDEAIGLSVYELFGQVAGNKVYKRMKRVFRTGISETFETLFELTSGQKWYRSSYQPVFDEAKNITSVQVISEDITNIKKVEYELIKAKEKAEENERFLSYKNMEYEALTEELRQINQELLITKEKIEESEEKFKSYFTNSLDGIFITDESGNYIEVNPAASTITGYTKEELSSMNIMQLTQNPNDINAADRIKTIIKAGNFSGETPFKKKDGTIGYWILSAVKLNDRRLLGFVKETTERKLDHLQLTSALNYVQTIFEKSPIGISTLKSNGEIVSTNPSLAQIVGGTEEQIVKQNINNIESWKKSGMLAAAKEALELGIETKNEFHYFSSFGKECWVSCLFVPFMHNAEQHLLLMLNDISERKQAEEKINESETHFRTLADSGQALIWTSGIDKKCNYFNQPWLNFTGRSLEQELGDGWIEGVHPDDLKQCIEIYVNAFDRREKFSMEYRIRHFSGEFRWIQDDGTPRYNSKGVFVGYIGHCLDITQRKRTERALLNSEARIISAIKATGLCLYEEEGSERSNRRMNFLNDRARIFLGIPKDQEYRAHEYWIDHIHPEDLLNIMNGKINDLEVGVVDIVSAEYRYLNDELGELWLRHVIHALERNADGKILRLVGAFQNITEHKQFELKLIEAKEKAEESEEKFRAIFENSQDAVGVSKKGVNIFFNNAYLNLFGYNSSDELVGKSILEQIAPYDRTRIAEYISKRAKGEDISNFYQVMGIRKDGSEFPFEVKVGTYNFNDEIYTIAIIRDITERKLYEETIEKSNLELRIAKGIAEENESKYRSMVTIIPDGILIHLDGKIVFANEAAGRILKAKNSDDLLGKPVFDLIHPDYKQIVKERIDKSLRETTIANTIEETLVDSEGKPVFVYTTGIPFQYQGKPSMLVAFTDISDLKTTEKELISAKVKAEEGEFRFKSISEQAIDGITLADTNGNYVFVNPAFCKMIGYSEKELLIMNVRDLLDPNEEPTLFPETKQKGSGRRINVKLQRKDKSIIYADINGKFLNIEKEQLVLGIVHDVTDRLEAERGLIAAKEKAEESDRLKTAFLQNLSHEIRTPLNAITGFSEMLNNPDLSENKRNSFNTIIQNSSSQLLSIVNDIITISSIETKQEKVNVQKVSINNIIVELLSIFKAQASNQNISLYSKQHLTDYQSEVYTDRSKLIQVLTNLITNALKFTHEGFIEFGYTLLGTQDNVQQSDDVIKTTTEHVELLGESDELLFYVKDTGIGIKPELHEKIFERFRQADLSINKTYGGTGLGLAISKAFVELMGGRIWVESEISKGGSTFYFTIPYKPVFVAEITNNDFKDNHCSSTILVAEDEEINFLYIEEVLNQKGLTIIHAKDGKEAVEICKSNPKICLILMDIKMPKMDGLTATKLIKEFRPDLPIIAQTAYALEHEIDKFKDQGFDGYLPKPIKQKTLNDLVDKYLKNKTE